MPVLAGVLGALLAEAAPPASAGPEWIAEEPGAVELLLAHLDRNGPDVGILRVDAERHGIVWGGTGPQACPHHVEASFDDVGSVRTRREGGFVLEVGGKVPTTLVLIPLPHAAWLETRHTINPGRMDSLLESSDVFVGRGVARSSGMPGVNAPTLVRRDPSKDVVSDTHKAVDHVLAAMGRVQSPSAVLREAFYGLPRDVGVGEVAASPGAFIGLSVRLVGHLEALPGGAYRMRDGDDTVAVAPEREVAALVQADLARGGVLEAEITGACTRRAQGPVIAFWGYTATPAEGARDAATPLVKLGQLVAAPRAWERKLVRVRGLFRGFNLYADLPPTTLVEPGDWVMKDEGAAVWATGRRPEGRGWSLDGLQAADTAQWLEVVGRPTSRKGVVRVRAVSVTPIAAPPGARVVPSRQLALARDAPPEVIFAIPLEGEMVPADGRFALQFSKYLDTDSLAGQVQARYVDDHALVPVRMDWDEARRTLLIVPLGRMQAGRTVELRLQPGIRDTQGHLLVPRTRGAEAETLRWPVAR